MKNSSTRDILDKSHLGSIQRKYRRSIDPAAAGRDVVSPAHRRGRAGTETGPAGVDIQVFECDQMACPLPPERKLPLQLNVFPAVSASQMLFPPAPATLDVTVMLPLVPLDAVTSRLLALIDVTSLSA